MAMDPLGPWAFTRSLAWSWIGTAVWSLLALGYAFLVVAGFWSRWAGHTEVRHILWLSIALVVTGRFIANLVCVRRERVNDEKAV